MLAPVEVASTLTSTEADELAHCEQIIHRGWQSFVAVGEALREIQDKKLYRDQYIRFEDYCRERWQYGKSQAYRLMDAARVVRLISPIGETPQVGVMPPMSEAQVRPLALLGEKDVKIIWEQVTKTAQATGQPVTARLVTSQIRAILPQEVRSTPARPNRRAVVQEALFELLTLIRDDGKARKRATQLMGQIMGTLFPK